MMSVMRKVVVVPVLALAALVACEDHAHDEAGTIAFTISGEETAATGFAFPPASLADVAFIDGWDVRFERVLVTVDDIVLTESPDLSPTDQAQTGEVVARAKGPWAVDLSVEGHAETPPLARAASVRPRHTGGGVSATGRGSAEDHSIRLVRLEGQNARGGEPFDPDVRYGFGYRVVPASASATRVNLGADASKDYDEMIQKGFTTLYVGTATFKGGTKCKSSVEGYDWSRVPSVVKFRLGFATPTQYLNCQNTDLTGKAFEGEEAQRGVQIASGGTSYAQLTFHLEHVFWNTVDHDQAILFFDQIAVAAKNGVVTTEDLATGDIASFADGQGGKLPWRSCISAVAPRAGERAFDPGSVPVVGASGDPARGLRHYGDFVAYQQSTMGHLNADGLCAVKREYPSPR